jgi:hypothetical protein
MVYRSVKNIHIKRLPLSEKSNFNFLNIFFVCITKANLTVLLDVQRIENAEVSILLSAAVLDTNVDLFNYCNQHVPKTCKYFCLVCLFFKIIL